MSFAHVFGNLRPVDLFEVKKSEIASNLAALVVHAGITRAELAQRLGWSKGRLSRALSGNENATLKTLYAIVDALGYDFDMTFRSAEAVGPKQPWDEAFPNEEIRMFGENRINEIFNALQDRERVRVFASAFHPDEEFYLNVLNDEAANEEKNDSSIALAA